MLFRKKSLQFSFQILNKMLIDKLEHFFLIFNIAYTYRYIEF